MKMTYDIQDGYQRGRMLGDALVHFAHQCIAEGMDESQMEKHLIAMFRLKLQVAQQQRNKQPNN